MKISEYPYAVYQAVENFDFAYSGLADFILAGVILGYTINLFRHKAKND